MTKDERFLLTLYKMANDKGDPTLPINRLHVGKALNESDRVVDNIIRHLAQANFVKKGEEGEIFLTSQGLRLIDELLDV